MHVSLRHLAKLSLKGRLGKPKAVAASIHPTHPVRARFAPSPTGFLHLGSLRTALYNYLLARNTKGTFVLRLEDTDQKRLVPGAEENIYQSLKWAGIVPDESPQVGGPYGPYRQLERGSIYRKYADELIAKGLAYKCFCSKERLVSLRESAHKLQPPTNVTYDRKCVHHSDEHDADAEYTVRFRSPDRYLKFTDLLHGEFDLQPQYNLADRRYDDFVILKLDGLPTYHFANVVDDHLMKITHVIRGEEWLMSTPKHIALYEAFGWQPPKFVHIPLLTSLEDKKLSKRKGDVGVTSMSEKGILPEALVNFVALFGWSPPRPEKGKKSKEVMTLDEIAEKFSLENLTKGNAKVNENKLWFFNKHHMLTRLQSEESRRELVDKYYPSFAKSHGQFDKEYFAKCLELTAGNLTNIDDLAIEHPYLFEDVDYLKLERPEHPLAIDLLKSLQALSNSENGLLPTEMVLAEVTGATAANLSQVVRYALMGGTPGVNVASMMEFLGQERVNERLSKAIASLESGQ